MEWAEAEAQRRATREAILDATGAMVSEHGLQAVTEDLIAAKAGVPVSRLRRLFTDLDTLLHTWHDRQVTNHLAVLSDASAQPGDITRRLDAVLRTYVAVVHQTHEHRATPRGAALHSDEHLAGPRQHLRALIRDLITEGVHSGAFRADLPPADLAERCVRALDTSSGHTSTSVIRQVVADAVADLKG